MLDIENNVGSLGRDLHVLPLRAALLLGKRPTHFNKPPLRGHSLQPSQAADHHRNAEMNGRPTYILFSQIHFW